MEPQNNEIIPTEVKAKPHHNGYEYYCNACWRHCLLGYYALPAPNAPAVLENVSYPADCPLWTIAVEEDEPTQQP